MRTLNLILFSFFVAFLFLLSYNLLYLLKVNVFGISMEIASLLSRVLSLIISIIAIRKITDIFSNLYPVTPPLLPNIKFGRAPFYFFLSIVLTFYAIAMPFKYFDLLIFESYFFMLKDKIVLILIFHVFLLINAFLEEYVFRYLLFYKLSNKVNLIVLISFNALFFSLVHVPTNILQFIHFSLGAVIFCLLYLKTQNFIYPVLLHFGANFSLWFNGTGYSESVDSFFLVKLVEDKILFWNIPSTVVIQFIFSIIILIGIIQLKKGKITPYTFMPKIKRLGG